MEKNMFLRIYLLFFGLPTLILGASLDQSSRAEICDDGMYNFPHCLDCNCNELGSVDYTCDAVSGQCACKDNVSGNQCDHCSDGWYGFPNCEDCACNPDGSVDISCTDYGGGCMCKENVSGLKCDVCAEGYSNFPACTEGGSGTEGCACNPEGSVDINECDDANGQCICLDNVIGLKCDVCAEGYSNFPECTEGGSGTEEGNVCAVPSWKGDSYCDDENNTAACGWDGGDCCGSNVNTNFCSICECLDPNFV